MKPSTIALIIFIYFLPFAWILLFPRTDMAGIVTFLTLILIAGAVVIILDEGSSGRKWHRQGKHKLR